MRIYTFHRYIFVAYLLLLCNNASADKNQYALVISKSAQELTIIDGEEVVKQFHITYGSGKGAKRIIGDKKTPLGIYKIINFKSNSKFHYFMQFNYPSMSDAWYGYRDKIITAKEFKNIINAIKNDKIPPQNTKLGGYIGIHGLGRTTSKKLAIHRDFNWTKGCIAMTNEEINDLRNYVTIGTKVIINE